MIDILNTAQLKKTLDKLKADASPLWGKMSPQHVVEHLAKSVKVSSGKIPIKFYFTQEDADKLKAKLIYGDMQLSAGIKNPTMGDEPPELIHTDLKSAITELDSEITHFENFYRQNPDVTNIHPRMGDLKHHEWLVFHNKHFTHHFKQYNLL